MAKKQSSASITPLGDRVLVRPLSPEELGTTTASGIIIPDSAHEKPEQGEVVAVGPGAREDGKLIKPAVSVGDRVMFSKYGYDEVTIENTKYYILKSDSLLAVIK